MSATAPQDPPLVSVALICYRQERFIQRAIAGVLAQQTPFPFELVIGDDASDDHTLALIQAQVHGQPLTVRILPTPQRLGMQQNVHRTVAACQGRYVALLEGDDYWTDPNKLHHQVSFMEAHPDTALCFHPVTLLREPDPQPSGQLPSPQRCQPFSPTAALVEENFIPTSSVLLRRHLWPDFDPRFAHLGLLDWVLWWKLASLGRIGCVDRLMGVYRIHSAGVWSGAAQHRRLHDLRRMAQLIAATAPPTWRQPWRQFAAARSRELFLEALHQDHFPTALYHLIQHLLDRLQALR